MKEKTDFCYTSRSTLALGKQRLGPDLLTEGIKRQLKLARSFTKLINHKTEFDKLGRRRNSEEIFGAELFVCFGTSNNATNANRRLQSCLIFTFIPSKILLRLLCNHW